MATKRCPRCDGKGFIELGIGLARMSCRECGGTGTITDKTIDDIVAEGYRDIRVTAPAMEPVTEPEPDHRQFVLPSQRDNTGTGKPDRSGKGKATGNRQRKGKKAKAGVRKRA